MELAGESGQYVYKTPISVLIEELHSNWDPTKLWLSSTLPDKWCMFLNHSTSLARQENVAPDSRLSWLTTEAVPVRVYITRHLTH